MNKEEGKTEEQTNNRPWLYKKGQSGNPGGRPKGSKSLKQWIKERMEVMTDEEREDFMNGLNKDIIWKMAEGNPQSDLTSGGEKILPSPILGGITNENKGTDSKI